MENKDLKLVTMKLTNSTINKIENIKNILNKNDSNEATIIGTSIDFLNFLLSETKNGSKIYIEKFDGNTEILKFNEL